MFRGFLNLRRLNNTYDEVNKAVTSNLGDFVLYERYTYKDDAHPFPSPLVADRDDADGPSDAEWDLMAEESAAMDAYEAGNHAF